PSGELPELVLRLCGQLELLHQLIRPPTRLFAGETEVAALELQNAPDREITVDVRLLGRQADHDLGADGLFTDVLPERADVTRLQARQADDGLDQGGLTRPVRSEQTEELSLDDFEVDPFQSL